MKRLLTTTLLLIALVAGATGVARHAHADVRDSMGIEGAFDQAKNDQVAADATAANTPTTQQQLPDPSQGFGSVMAWIMSLFAWLVGVAAITLDNAVYYTVVTMGSYVNKLSAVGVTWRILRDIGNIMFIFGFIAVGITTILNVDWYGIRKMLPMLLVGAIFLNFSLFFAEAVVDVGNLFATQFYTQINGGQAAGAKSFDPGFTIRVSQEGISNRLMSQLGLPTIYNEANRNQEIFKTGNTWIIGFMGIILFLVTAFVMFSFAFILIARFVALIFLIIVAPIGFAGLAVPGFAARAQQWWKMLFEQTITAPILMLMLYIALAVITDANFLTGFCIPGQSTLTGDVNTNTACVANAVGWVSGNFAGFGSFILSFLVAMGLLLLVLVYAKRWSAFGGDAATELAGKMTFGLTGWAANRTIGRVAYFGGRRLQQIQGFNRFDAATGRVLSRGLKQAATGSFDLRGSGILSKIPLGDNIKPGDAAKDGFVGARKRTIEDHEKAAKAIEEAHKEASTVRKDEAFAIAEAEKRQLAAGQAVTASQKRVDEIQTTVLDAKDRLSKATTEEARRAANQALDTAEGNLKNAKESLKDAKEAEKIAVRATAAAEMVRDKRLKEGIKKNKIAYAEWISNKWNPITWTVAYGPGGGAAAEKIIKEAKSKKSKDQQISELVKEAAKDTVVETVEERASTPAPGGAPAAAPAAPHP